MSYWVEVHCDVRSETPNPALSRLNNENVCHSLSNSNPSAHTVDGALGVQQAIEEAKRRRWVRRRITEHGATYLGWACPHCQKFPPAEEPAP